MSDPFQVVRDFESALCEYTGAKYAVTTTSCTMALLLAFKATGPWHSALEIPKRTYISVPMSILHSGHRVRFRDADWSGEYKIGPTRIWDSARRFTAGMYRENDIQCVSFHWSKILGLGQGGAILHSSADLDEVLRRLRFDGRGEGVAVKDDNITMLGWHCYMAPETAANGLVRLALLPEHNADLPNDDYPDLSQMEIFK